MNARQDHQHWDELAAGYALDALEPDQELEFTEHLSGCAICVSGLDEHEFVAAQLASLAAGSSEVRMPAWSSMRLAVVGRETAAPVVALDQRRPPKRAPRLLAAAAGILALAGVAVATWQVTQPSPGAATRAIADCRHRAGCAVVRLHASRQPDPAVVLVSHGSATLVPMAMKPPAAGRTYVLWQLPRTGSPVPVAAFRATARDTTSPLVTSYADTAAFAVSLEPAGAPPSRPTEVLAVGSTST